MIDLIGMIWLVVKVLMYVLLGIVLLYVIREVRVYNNLSYFRKQGVKCIYNPGFGMFWNFAPVPSNLDRLSRAREFFESVKEEPLVMGNCHKHAGSIGFLLDKELIKEFFLKETDCTIKMELLSRTNAGFFCHNGERVIDSRAMYNKYFSYQNMRKLVWSIYQISDRKFKQLSLNLELESNKNSKEGQRINLKQILNELFADLISKILFGDESKTKLEDGTDLIIAIEDYIHDLFKLLTDPVNLMSLEFLHDYGLMPKTRINEKRYEKIEKACFKMYNQRLEKGPKDFPNILDILVDRNKELSKESKPLLSKFDITGDIVMFNFAGSDTSKESISSAIVLLSENLIQQEEFSKIASRIISREDLEKGEEHFSSVVVERIENDIELNRYTKEILRLFSPVVSIAPRMFTKQTKIGKYQFRPGDSLAVPLYFLQTLSNRWDKPLEFNPSRYEQEELGSGEKNRTLFPFSLGKRGCIGKTLGEMLLKTILIAFFNNLKSENDPEYEKRTDFSLTYGFLNPTVYVRQK